MGRMDNGWTVTDSLEDAEHLRCVDVFRRPDGSFGFLEFRRDPEDSGAWTVVQFYSSVAFPTKDDALAAATRTVGWLEAARAQE